MKKPRRRRTDMTDEQRAAVEEARALLWRAGFAGEQVRVWVPRVHMDAKSEQEQRILLALLQDTPPREISRKEDVSLRKVFMLRHRLCKVPP